MGILSYIRLASYAVLLIAALSAGYKVYSTIREHAQMEILYDLQKADLNAKKDYITKLEGDVAIQASFISKQLKEVDNLNAQLENVTKNLPPDASDLAPESIRETVRRIKGKK